jgi:hypothetical protein
MKTKIFILLFAVFCTGIFAQEEVKPTRKIYCEVLGTAKFMSNKVTITIDFGQETKWGQNVRLRDEQTGKVAVFNSMIDALNYMGNDGWEFEQAYVVTAGGGTSSQNVYHWLLSKRILIE